MTKPLIGPPPNRQKIHCMQCEIDVLAELKNGMEIYRAGWLSHKHFWRCPACLNYVGCHGNSTKPLGCIPTPLMRSARLEIHKVLDPLWKSGRYSRSELYAKLSERLGWQYHTADLNDMVEAKRVWRIVKELAA